MYHLTTQKRELKCLHNSNIVKPTRRKQSTILPLKLYKGNNTTTRKDDIEGYFNIKTNIENIMYTFLYEYIIISGNLEGI